MRRGHSGKGFAGALGQANVLRAHRSTAETEAQKRGWRRGETTAGEGTVVGVLFAVPSPRR